jgi:hypothetical protein
VADPVRTRLPDPSPRVARWVTAATAVAAALFLLGAVVALADPALLVGSGAHVGSAARVHAGYIFSRDLAISVALAGLLLVRATRLLAGALLLAGVVQVLDVLVDVATARFALVPGLAVLAGLLLAAAAGTSPTPLWRAATWRDVHPPAA